MADLCIFYYNSGSGKITNIKPGFSMDRFTWRSVKVEFWSKYCTSVKIYNPLWGSLLWIFCKLRENATSFLKIIQDRNLAFTRGSKDSYHMHSKDQQLHSKKFLQCLYISKSIVPRNLFLRKSLQE